MTVKKAPNVGPSGIEVAYECFGEADAPPVLLIQGLGSQMLGWHEGFCAALVARGLRPIRFDNRDVGLSSEITVVPEPLAGSDLQAKFALDLCSSSRDNIHRQAPSGSRRSASRFTHSVYFPFLHW